MKTIVVNPYCHNEQYYGLFGKLMLGTTKVTLFSSAVQCFVLNFFCAQ